MSTGRRSGRRAQQEQNQALAWERVLTPRVVRLLPVLLAGIAFVVYLFTMAPRLTWEHAGRDGGDLITAAWYMGVPHPTGYPTYTLLAALFARLPVGSVAWRVHLFSGLTSAVTVALVFLIGRRLARRRAEPIDAPATLGAAVGALFRTLDPMAPATIASHGSSHPHPAVRACVVSCCAVARGLHAGHLTPEDLDTLLGHSVRDVEDTWADLLLPGQNPEPPARWAESVQSGVSELLDSYAAKRSLLEQYTHLPRRWHDWEWPTPPQRP